jgi:hypothetical protein
LNECVVFGCVYRCIVYCVCVNYADFLIAVVLVILFSAKKIIAQANLRWLRMGCRRLVSVIYVGWADHRRLSGLTYNAP